MPRPKKGRHVGFYPKNTVFIPQNESDSETILTFEEIESLRLCDLEGMDQSSAADCMNISRGTLQRILGSARKKVAEAVIHGTFIKIAHFECGRDDCAYRLENNQCRKNCRYHHTFGEKGENDMDKEENSCGCEKNQRDCACHADEEDTNESEYFFSKEHEITQIEENIKYLEKRLVQANKRLLELRED